MRFTSALLIGYFLTLLLASRCIAQKADFFLSDKGLGQGAINQPLDFGFPFEGQETLTLYLYYTLNGPSKTPISEGLFIDIESSSPDTAIFSRAETIDFALMVNDFKVGSRWGNWGVSGETGVLTSGYVDELSCFGFAAMGLQPDPFGTFIDSGFDAEADAYLVAKIDMHILSIGITNLTMSLGKGQIVNRTGDVIEKLNPVFGCARINPFLGSDVSQLGCSLSAAPVLGDVNLDGRVDLLDVSPFVNLLASSGFQVEGDINRDGSLNLLDIDGFINLLNGYCPSANPGQFLLGDANCDGCIDLADLPALEAAIASDATEICDFEQTDLTMDGTINLLDVQPLIDMILKH